MIPVRTGMGNIGAIVQYLRSVKIELLFQNLFVFSKKEKSFLKHKTIAAGTVPIKYVVCKYIHCMYVYVRTHVTHFAPPTHLHYLVLPHRPLPCKSENQRNCIILCMFGSLFRPMFHHYVVLIHYFILHRLVKYIHLCARKLSGRDSALKQDV